LPKYSKILSGLSVFDSVHTAPGEFENAALSPVTETVLLEVALPLNDYEDAGFVF